MAMRSAPSSAGVGIAMLLLRVERKLVFLLLEFGWSHVRTRFGRVAILRIVRCRRHLYSSAIRLTIG